MNREELPKRIRVSSGSAVVLGLTTGMLDAKPTTIYLLTYRSNKCSANCAFCPQARGSQGKADMLSRVTWPPFPTKHVVSGIGHAFRREEIKRVCIQALNYPTVFDDIFSIATEILSHVDIPLSVSCQPIDRNQMKRLSEAGVERICIPLDAATEELFDSVKGHAVDGAYEWEKQRRALKDAVHIFGEDFVSTHLIVGLGEREEEIVRTIQWCVDLGIYPSLFAFTPIPGTSLEDHRQPSISHYRRIQIAQHLITKGRTHYENMSFNEEGRLIHLGIPRKQLWQMIRTGKPFITSGCPGCNRPYYNERSTGPLYNYPRPPLPEEIAKIMKQTQIYSHPKYPSLK